jgi:hypothetical protein
VQGAGVFVLTQLHQVQPVPDGLASRELLAKGIPALVRLDNGVNPLDAIQVGSPPISPVAGTRDAKSRYLVVPERVAVALSLHQNDVPGLARLVEEP